MDNLKEAWANGAQLQYFQVYGYDSEWTDYINNSCPDFSNTWWAWRIKPTS